MAAKSRKRATRSGGSSMAGWIVTLTLPLLAGVTLGYVWRSYYPLALPIESKLVSDGSSSDLGDTTLRDMARAAERRAEQAERERERLAARVQELEQDQVRTERELGDLHIKSVLQSKVE